MSFRTSWNRQITHWSRLWKVNLQFKYLWDRVQNICRVMVYSYLIIFSQNNISFLSYIHTGSTGKPIQRKKMKNLISIAFSLCQDTVSILHLYYIDFLSCAFLINTQYNLSEIASLDTYDFHCKWWEGWSVVSLKIRGLQPHRIKRQLEGCLDIWKLLWIKLGATVSSEHITLLNNENFHYPWIVKQQNLQTKYSKINRNTYILLEN